MNYTISKNGTKADIVFEGNITFSENVVFRDMLKEVSEHSIKEAVFDLSDVGMIDSAGLGMFLIAKEQADNEGWRISVTGAVGHVANMLKLTKLSQLLETGD